MTAGITAAMTAAMMITTATNGADAMIARVLTRDTATVAENGLMTAYATTKINTATDAMIATKEMTATLLVAATTAMAGGVHLSEGMRMTGGIVMTAMTATENKVAPIMIAVHAMTGAIGMTTTTAAGIEEIDSIFLYIQLKRVKNKLLFTSSSFFLHYAKQMKQ